MIFKLIIIMCFVLMISNFYWMSATIVNYNARQTCCEYQEKDIIIIKSLNDKCNNSSLKSVDAILNKCDSKMSFFEWTPLGWTP